MIKTRLEFVGVSEIIGNKDITLLLLADLEGRRQISVVCETDIACQIQMRRTGNANTETLLPEVLCRLFDFKSHSDAELVITDIENGQYKAYLAGIGDRQPVPVRISDAVLLSVVADIPIYMDAVLMKRQSVAYMADAGKVSVPINTVTDEMLDEALEQAIADENYELASYLNSEKKRRKRNPDAGD